MSDPDDQSADVYSPVHPQGHGAFNAAPAGFPPSPPPPPSYGPGPDWSGGGRAGRLYDANATSDERLYAMFEHLSYFCWLLGVPGLLVTVILWLIKKNESPYIDDHGRESINMQLSMIIYTLGAFLAGFIACGVPWILSAAIPIVAIVFAIMGAVAAHRGDYYRYPAVIRFL